MEMFFMKRFLVVVFVILVAATSAAADECGGNEASGCRNKREALKLKAVAIAAILCAGAIGVCFPICTKNMFALRAEGGIFFVIKAFGAGVILATGFVHILPDAFECLGSDCLSPNPWANFPMAGMIAMATALGTLMIDAIAMSYYQRSHYAQQSQKSNDGLSSGNGVGGLEKGPVNAHSDTESARNGLDDGRHETHIHAHSHASHGHAHGSNTALEDATLRRKIVSQVLELGIVVHSVIIGVSLGASQSPCTIRPLVAALTFHQFFEGMGLGSCILQAAFRARSKAVMAILFSITTPFGIAVGIGISSSYRENSPKALAVEGVLNAASSGILIYMSLVDLLAADFLNSRMQKSAPVQLGAYLALLFGAAAMSLLAVWA